VEPRINKPRNQTKETEAVPAGKQHKKKINAKFEKETKQVGRTPSQANRESILQKKRQKGGGKEEG